MSSASTADDPPDHLAGLAPDVIVCGGRRCRQIPSAAAAPAASSSVGALAAARMPREHVGRFAPWIGERAGAGVTDRRPHAFGCARQVDVAHPEVRDGVDHGVLHCGGRPDRCRLADALCAERVERRRRLGRERLERRQFGCCHDAVVGEVRGHRVAVAVEAHLFEQRLAHAGRDATVLLALDEQRCEYRAAVVDGHVAQEPDLAGVGIDLDDGDVRTEREGGAVLVEVELAVELLADVGCTRGEFAPRERLGGYARDTDRPRCGVDHDVGRVGLEQPARPAVWPWSPSPRLRRARPSRRAAVIVTHRCRRRFVPGRCRRRRA